MSSIDLEDATRHQNIAIRQFQLQQSAMLERTRERVDEIRQRAVEVHGTTIKQRNATLAEFTNSLNVTVRRVRDQHEFVRRSLRREAINRDVHLRVSRSLESLEEFIRVIRQPTVTEQKLIEAIADPAVSGTSIDRARRASVADLIQSVQRQLIQQYEFLNIAAHELRTPIMPILASAEILKGQLGEGSKELAIIMRNALRLQQLAENILIAARVENSKLTLSKESFELNLLVRQAIQDKEYAIGDKNVRILFIALADELTIYADRSKIGQVLANLLDNAIKFTHVGRITVTTEMDGVEAVVTVRDDGPGLDPDVVPYLFSRFVSKSAKGTGLGLFICKSIIEAHGGRISGRTLPGIGGGSEFTFTLPLSLAAESRTS